MPFFQEALCVCRTEIIFPEEPFVRSNRYQFSGRSFFILIEQITFFQEDPFFDRIFQEQVFFFHRTDADFPGEYPCRTDIFLRYKSRWLLS